MPCDVLEVLEDGRVKVKMRADLGVKSWHGKNEYGNWTSEEIFTPSMVVPRRAIKPPARGNFHATILPYRWEVGIKRERKEKMGMKEISISCGKVSVFIEGDKVMVHFERPSTKAEKKKDPEAKITSETVSIVFGGEQSPEVNVDRELSA